MERGAPVDFTLGKQNQSRGLAFRRTHTEAPAPSLKPKEQGAKVQELPRPRRAPRPPRTQGARPGTPLSLRAGDTTAAGPFLPKSLRTSPPPLGIFLPISSVSGDGLRLNLKFSRLGRFGNLPRRDPPTPTPPARQPPRTPRPPPRPARPDPGSAPAAAPAPGPACPRGHLPPRAPPAPGPGPAAAPPAHRRFSSSGRPRAGPRGPAPAAEGKRAGVGGRGRAARKRRRGRGGRGGEPRRASPSDPSLRA